MKQIETDTYQNERNSNRFKSDQNKQKRIRNRQKLTLVDSKLIETNWTVSKHTETISETVSKHLATN